MSDLTPSDPPPYPSYPGDGDAPSRYPAPPPPPGSWAPPGRPQKVDRLGVAALACAALVVVSDVVMAGLAFPARTTYLEAADEGTDALDVFTVYDVFGFVYFPVMVAAFAVTSVWMYRMRSNVDLLRPEIHHARSKGWAWGGWICPVVSLWFPFQFVRDLLRRHPGGSTPPVVGWWWGFFLLTLVTDQLGGNLLPVQGEIDRSVVEALPILESISAAVTAVAFVLWFRVIRRLRVDQRDLVGTTA